MQNVRGGYTYVYGFSLDTAGPRDNLKIVLSPHFQLYDGVTPCDRSQVTLGAQHGSLK